MIFSFGVTSHIVEAQFSLAQIPPLENKQPLTLVAEKGFWTDYLQQQLLPKFTAQTQVPVKVISLSLDDMYQRQTQSLLAGEGQFDLLTMEAGWAKEWASNGYTVPLNELAQLYDPLGEQSIDHYLEPYYASLLNILSYRNQIHAIPYNNYVMGNHYRADLFEHPQEKAAFKARFDYALAPPIDMQQLLDVSEFFTRQAGEKLAGKKLTAPFYGVALMAGNRPHINDEFSAILWSLEGNWLKPHYEAQALTLFTIAANNPPLAQAAGIYRKLRTFAYPTDANFAFEQAANAIAQGHVAMWPFAYNNLWHASYAVEANVEGAKLNVAQVPGGKPYNGAYAFAVAYDSKNPRAAYWLLKYMGSYQAQYDYALGGGNPCRADVVLSTQLAKPEHRSINGAFTASHKANIAWAKNINQQGHFTSSAMGRIYPELTTACYNLANPNNDIDTQVQLLQQRILEIQNHYGEVPAIVK
ncbi:ABC transporter substrate-binding protein [Shewanella waksmanii]|uniref:ABC transporter substrate-binding protein n=1 Tax=Shewanella waksmanii TaxID=213783 RepID=UPI003736C21B